MNVLIVSFYSPPANNVAADRISGYLKFLPRKGANVYLITRYFEESLLNVTDMNVGLTDAGLASDFVTKGAYRYTNFTASNRRKTFSKCFPPGLRGLYNLKKIDVFHYGWYRYFFEAFESLIKEVKLDLVILSYGPPVTLLLARQIAEKYKLKTVVEFRDAYINEADKGLKRSIKVSNQNKLLANVSGFIFSQEGAKDYFYNEPNNKLVNIPGFVLHHGFDQDQVSGETKLADQEVISRFIKFRSAKKVIAIFPGTLYSGQDIEFFLLTMRKLAVLHPNLFGICLLGTYFDGREPLASDDHIMILPKVEKHVSLQLMMKSEILLFPVWMGRYSGGSGKMSEYCGLKKFVAVSPNPQEDVVNFMKFNQNARFFETNEQLEVFIGNIANGQLVPVDANIEFYSKQYNFGKLVEFLNGLNER